MTLAKLPNSGPTRSVPPISIKHFGLMLRDRPEAFADSGGQDDGFHDVHGSACKHLLEGREKSLDMRSVRAPILAMRKIFDSNCP